MSLNCCRVLGGMALLNFSQNLVLGINDLFDVYAFQAEGDLFDFVLREEQYPLVELPVRM